MRKLYLTWMASVDGERWPFAESTRFGYRGVFNAAIVILLFVGLYSLLKNPAFGLALKGRGLKHKNQYRL